MALLIYGFLIVIMLGAGILFASAIPARSARVGLGTVFFLGLVVDITWLAAPMFDWSTGLGDAAWLIAFAIAGISAWLAAWYHLGATGQPPWPWPTGRDTAFLLVVVAVFGVIVLLLPVPLDTDAQGFGYLALTLRDGGNFTSLAPWHPEIEYLYSPGFPGLMAHLSARFDPGLQTLQLAFGAMTTALFVWLAYDLGCEIGERRTGRAFMLAALIGTGLTTAFMDSHFTALLALLFSLGFVTFVLRYLEAGRWFDALGAAICLAGVPFSQPDTTLALIMGYGPWLIVLGVSRPRPKPGTWLVLAVAIPLMALLITAPWLIRIRDLLGSGIESPFEVATKHWRTLVVMHGGVIVVLAGIGALLGLRQRRPEYWLSLVWLVSIVEFSTVGALENAFPGLVGPLLKYDYPFSLAWHGPIIPYLILGGSALAWLAHRIDGTWLDRLIYRLTPLALALVLLGLVSGAALFDDLLAESKDRASFYGAFSSADDVAAMEWLRDHAPAGARVLNHPGPHEADWAPVISERDTVFFRPQEFFRHTEKAESEQDLFLYFWTAPGEHHRALLVAQKIDYVLVPQVFGNPGSFADMIRWREPLPEAAAYVVTSLEGLSYLQLVFDQDGARVYEVVTEAADPAPALQ
jgi:hypothetical protein